MKLKTILYLNKIKNNSFFKDLKEYLTERVNEKKLSDKNIEYIYKNLYKNKSAYINQNIFPVGEFLSQGYSTDEAEKLTELLEDAHGKTIFAYDKSEIGYKYNKLFYDLRYVYIKYNEIYKQTNLMEETIKECKELMKNTTIQQRECEVKIYDDRIYSKNELASYYEQNEKDMQKLRTEFNMSFPENERNKPEKRILVAVTVLAGIELRNLRRENNNLDGEMEKSPYTQEQEKMMV